jgi:hypothetical protein
MNNEIEATKVQSTSLYSRVTLRDTGLDADLALRAGRAIYIARGRGVRRLSCFCSLGESSDNPKEGGEDDGDGGELHGYAAGVVLGMWGVMVNMSNWPCILYPVLNSSTPRLMSAKRACPERSCMGAG